MLNYNVNVLIKFTKSVSYNIQMKTVLVVGAGPAGLTMATIALLNDYKVILWRKWNVF